jgi:hypothetical protein
MKTPTPRTAKTRWIEVIRLRGASPAADALARRLVAALQGGRGDGLVALRLYRSATIAGDLCVHLHHETDSRPDPAAGALVAAELQAHGLTDRTLWREVDGEESEDRR